MLANARNRLSSRAYTSSPRESAASPGYPTISRPELRHQTVTTHVTVREERLLVSRDVIANTAGLTDKAANTFNAMNAAERDYLRAIAPALRASGRLEDLQMAGELNAAIKRLGEAFDKATSVLKIAAGIAADLRDRRGNGNQSSWVSLNRQTLEALEDVGIQLVTARETVAGYVNIAVTKGLISPAVAGNLKLFAAGAAAGGFDMALGTQHLMLGIGDRADAVATLLGGVSKSAAAVAVMAMTDAALPAVAIPLAVGFILDLAAKQTLPFAIALRNGVTHDDQSIVAIYVQSQKNAQRSGKPVVSFEEFYNRDPEVFAIVSADARRAADTIFGVTAPKQPTPPEFSVVTTTITRESYREVCRAQVCVVTDFLAAPQSATTATQPAPPREATGSGVATGTATGVGQTVTPPQYVCQGDNDPLCNPSPLKITDQRSGCTGSAAAMARCRTTSQPGPPPCPPGDPKCSSQTHGTCPPGDPRCGPSGPPPTARPCPPGDPTCRPDLTSLPGYMTLRLKPITGQLRDLRQLNGQRTPAGTVIEK